MDLHQLVKLQRSLRRKKPRTLRLRKRPIQKKIQKNPQMIPRQKQPMRKLLRKLHLLKRQLRK